MEMYLSYKTLIISKIPFPSFILVVCCFITRALKAIVSFLKAPQTLQIRQKGWFCVTVFYLFFIPFVLSDHVSRKPKKMFLSIGQRHASFNDPFNISCRIDNATECKHPTWLYGIKANGELRWKVLARGDIPFTGQYLSRIYNATDGVTYDITILQLQSDDVGAWLRFECDKYNNVTQRLIQIDDRLVVSPEIFNSTFAMVNETIIVITIIMNAYPEPGNCSLTILQSNTHIHTFTYHRTYFTNVTEPDLFNTTYRGFSHIPFRVCKPNVTVTCYLGDRFISEYYLPTVCDELEKMSEEMTSWSTIVIVIISCACILITLSAVAVARCIWTKKRKDQYKTRNNI